MTLFATAAGRYEPSERGEWLAALYDGYPDDQRKPVRLSRLTIAFHLAVLLVAAVFQLWLLVLLISLPHESPVGCAISSASPCIAACKAR